MFAVNLICVAVNSAVASEQETSGQTGVGLAVGSGLGVGPVGSYRFSSKLSVQAMLGFGGVGTGLDFLGLHSIKLEPFDLFAGLGLRYIAKPSETQYAILVPRGISSYLAGGMEVSLLSNLFRGWRISEFAVFGYDFFNEKQMVQSTQGLVEDTDFLRFHYGYGMIYYFGKKASAEDEWSRPAPRPKRTRARAPLPRNRELQHKYQVATALYKSGDYAGAYRKAYAILKADRRHWRAWGIIGNCQYKKGDVQDAIVSYQHSLDIHPNNPKLRAWVKKLRRENSSAF